MEASSATLDRILRPVRIQHGPDKRGTKPGRCRARRFRFAADPDWQTNQAGNRDSEKKLRAIERIRRVLEPILIQRIKKFPPLG